MSMYNVHVPIVMLRILEAGKGKRGGRRGPVPRMVGVDATAVIRRLGPLHARMATNCARFSESPKPSNRHRGVVGSYCSYEIGIYPPSHTGRRGTGFTRELAQSYMRDRQPRRLHS